MSEEMFVQDDCHYESPLEWLWIEVLGGCGCGSGDNGELAWGVLEHFATPHEERPFPWYYESREREVLAHWLDSKELIEHGTSAAGSWLTEEGKRVHGIIQSALEGGEPKP